MINDWMQALRDAAALHGEMQKIYLTAGCVGMVIVAICIVQELGLRKSVLAIGWPGIFGIGFAAICAAFLVIVGLL